MFVPCGGVAAARAEDFVCRLGFKGHHTLRNSREGDRILGFAFVTFVTGTMDASQPSFLPEQYRGYPNQIRTLRLKRFELHEAFFLIFNLPGVIKTELSRRAHETEMKAFMLQLLYQACCCLLI